MSIWLYQKDDLEKSVSAVDDMEPTTKDVKVYVHKRDVSVNKQLVSDDAISLDGGPMPRAYGARRGGWMGLS